MHGKIIKEDKEQLTEENKDIDSLKEENPKGYKQAEKHLNSQHEMITKTAGLIHKIRER